MSGPDLSLSLDDRIKHQSRRILVPRRAHSSSSSSSSSTTRHLPQLYPRSSSPSPSSSSSSPSSSSSSPSPSPSFRIEDEHLQPGHKRKYVMTFTEQELASRRRHFGSELSIIDRKKFDREFDVNTLALSSTNRKVYDENPHLRQVFANERELVMKDRELALHDRCEHSNVQHHLGRTPYQRRQGEAKTVDHWGQRKLLLSEIEFLSRFASASAAGPSSSSSSSSSSMVVVYAGAAPGTHIPFLQRLFPRLRWILVDP
eukprot:TRINITY_DN2832_c0_g1_i3.p1 TRINITY_DN2832_c0_g1~~TRINITY_DN2832_c0_g1_i3.p1  ORF type:complete len:258 (+),score=73.19 TRINITY_DN2832_c0_g1_i3:51-824(+)